MNARTLLAGVAVGACLVGGVASADAVFGDTVKLRNGDALEGKATDLGESVQVVSGKENVDKLKRGEPVANPDKIISMKVAADVK